MSKSRSTDERALCREARPKQRFGQEELDRVSELLDVSGPRQQAVFAVNEILPHLRPIARDHGNAGGHRFDDDVRDAPLAVGPRRIHEHGRALEETPEFLLGERAH